MPGWSVGPSIFSDLWTRFPEREHVGCDFSSCVEPSDFAQVARHAVLGRAQVDVVGWSLGAMAALELASTDPGCIGRLVLVSGSSCFLAQGEEGNGVSVDVLDRMRAALQERPLQVVEAFQQRMFSRGERAAGHYRSWRSLYGTACPSREALSAGLDYLRGFAVDGSSVHTETHILHGTEDGICSLSGAHEMSMTIAGADLTVWPDVGHVPFFTKREEFGRWMCNLLAA
jgi:pimeloyl-[acyl-carrier protein] methyl ester esterase